MLLRSQPLNSKISEKLAADSKEECEAMTERNILSQYIGDMYRPKLIRIRILRGLVNC